MYVIINSSDIPYDVTPYGYNSVYLTLYGLYGPVWLIRPSMALHDLMFYLIPFYNLPLLSSPYVCLILTLYISDSQQKYHGLHLTCTWKQLMGNLYYFGISTIRRQIKNTITPHKLKFNFLLGDVLFFCSFDFRRWYHNSNIEGLSNIEVLYSIHIYMIKYPPNLGLTGSCSEFFDQ